MRYFEHDTNSLDDEKMYLLHMNFGYEGVGLFFCILEKLAKQEKPINTDVLKRQLRVGKKLEKCWKFMESLEIISSNNGETFNKRLTNFIETYAEKKEKIAKRVLEYREKQQVTENVTRYKQDCNSIDKIRLDKIRLEENIVKPLTPFQGDEVVQTSYEKKEVEKPPRKRLTKFIPDLSVLPDQASRDLIQEFLDYRTEKGKPYKTQKGIDRLISQLRTLAGGSFTRAKAILDQSISAEWDGIFPLKNQTNGKHEPSHADHVESVIRIAEQVVRNAANNDS